MTKDYPWGKGTPKWTLDSTANDSDKSFTVPTGKIWKLVMIEGAMETTATVGNRIMKVSITNGTNLVYTTVKSSNVAASNSWGGLYIFGGYGTISGNRSALYSIAADSTVQTYDHGPELILPAGYVIRVWDSAAIDAVADDLTISIHYIEYDA